MGVIALEWKPFFGKELIPKRPKTMNLYVGGLGIAAALEPFKMIIAECSDPICFIGGAMGLYQIGMGNREDGFKQVLNATLAQVGFFVWPKIQIAIRAGLGG